MNFEQMKLGDIAEIQTGPFGSQLHKGDYVDIGTPIITVEHLGENFIIHSNIPQVNDSDTKRLSKFLLKRGDIVFSRVGSVDRRAYVRDEEEGWLFSGRCLRVRVTDIKLNPLYLSYYFGLEEFKEYIRNIAVGATMPSLNTKILSDIIVPIPIILAQNWISFTLYNLDKLILLNNQINKTLEEMAQAIFKHWFIDFEFPDGNGQPYKSSGGDMVDSEMGLIPKGWRVGRLSELISIKYGKDHKKLEDGNIPVYGSGGVMRYVNSSLYSLESVLIPRKGTLNNVIFVEEPFWSVDTMFYTEMKYKYIAKFIYFFMKSKDLISMNVGSAVPSMTTDVLNKIPVVISSEIIFRQYDEVIASLFNKMKANSKENITLSAIRNKLLPKLMSGEIRVPIENEVS